MKELFWVGMIAFMAISIVHLPDIVLDCVEYHTREEKNNPYYTEEWYNSLRKGTQWENFEAPVKSKVE